MMDNGLEKMINLRDEWLINPTSPEQIQKVTKALRQLKEEHTRQLKPFSDPNSIHKNIVTGCENMLYHLDKLSQIT